MQVKMVLRGEDCIVYFAKDEGNLMVLQEGRFGIDNNTNTKY